MDRKEAIMVGIFRRILCRGRFLFPLSLLFIGCFATLCPGEEKQDIHWGGSIMFGPHARGHLNFTYFAALPRASLPLHKKWDLEFEGNLSHYLIRRERDLYLIGVNGNLLFKPVQWGRVTPFLIGGAGLAYNNNSGFAWELGDSHTAGILQGGAGIFYDIGEKFLLRGEYRFHHVSDPFERDHGLNTHGFLIGVAF